MPEFDEAIEQFESEITEAFLAKYDGLPRDRTQDRIETSPVAKIDIRKFRDVYRAQSIYPLDRLESLIYQLMDIKLQLFFILELDLGLYNRLIYDQGFTRENISKNPYIFLRKLSLDQTLIVKSRILFERVMNLIYFLETGNDLEVASSKKTKFFQFVTVSDKWTFWEDYKDYIEWFDNQFRTPEVHKRSFLRKHFIMKTEVANDEISALTNIIMNIFWPSLMEVIQGHKFTAKL